jgi:hypothetical protein
MGNQFISVVAIKFERLLTIPPRMPVDPARRLKSCQRFCYVIQTCRPLKDIWEKSVMPRQCVGSTTFMDNLADGRAEDLTLVRPFQRLILKMMVCIGIVKNPDAQILNFRIIILEH